MPHASGSPPSRRPASTCTRSTCRPARRQRRSASTSGWSPSLAREEHVQPAAVQIEDAAAPAVKASAGGRTILNVVHYPVFGGPHNRIQRLAEPLRERGWRTIAALPDEPGNAAARLRSDGVPVVQLSMGRL